MFQTLKELASFPKQLQFSHPVLVIQLSFIYIRVCVCAQKNTHTHAYVQLFNSYSLESNSHIFLVSVLDNVLNEGWDGMI